MISFSGRHYSPFIILHCVRWYVSYALSYRNIEEMMSENGFNIDHATLNRWVLHFEPLLEKKAHKYKRPVYGSWRIDETYLKIKGKSRYLYRAVGKYGKIVDFMVSKKRDAAAAKNFFRKAFVSNGLPHRVNIDIVEASSQESVIMRSYRGKYLNNIVEQDHLHLKKIMRPLGGFRKLHTAARTIAGRSASYANQDKNP